MKKCSAFYLTWLLLAVLGQLVLASVSLWGCGTGNIDNKLDDDKDAIVGSGCGVTTDYVRLRSEPKILGNDGKPLSNILMTLWGGCELNILSTSPGDVYNQETKRNLWHQVKVLDGSGQIGWVAADFVQAKACGSPHPTTPVVTNVLQSRGDIFGLSIGSYRHRSNPGVHFDIDGMKELGARWVRLEAARPAAEAEGQDPSNYFGESISALHARCIKVLLIVDYATAKASTGGLVDANVYAERRTAKYVDSPGWEAYVPAFRADLEELVNGLLTLPDAWEIWNEPDQYEPIAYGTSGSGIPPQYFQMILDASLSVIRARDPGAVIISGGSSSGNPNYLTDVARAPKIPGNVLSRLNGIGIHVYRGPWSADTSRYLRGSTRENHLAAAGVNLPIWLTEAGSTGADTDPKGQADFVSGVYEIVAADREAGVPWGPAFYFSFNDNVGLENEHFGLSDGQGNHRPGWYEYQNRAGKAVDCFIPSSD